MKIYDLSAIPEELLSSVGGKAKGLNQLLGFGFNVPNGFILVDVNTAEDCEKAYEYYQEKNMGKVAVRSSATIEDGASFSNAGQYETFLNVSGKEDFIKAVQNCIASLDNYRSQVYSKTFLGGDKEVENKMTVVVQEMVDAECAGVMFTKDPMDPSTVLIECVKGLGESLVSGTQTAEQYRVARIYRAEEGKILESDGTLLTKEQTMSLYKSAIKAEQAFGMPMDIEWAIDKNGNILFVQARPITTVSINEFDYGYDVTDQTITTCNVREMLSCAVTPLTMSTSVFGLDYGMRKMMEKNHTIKNVDDLPPFSCITPFYNNMFFNQTTNYIVSYRIAGTSKESSDVVICGRVLDEFPDKFSDPSPQIVRLARMIYFLPYILSGKKAVNGMKKVVDSLHFNYDDTIEGLYKQQEENFDLLKEAWFCHYCSSYFSGAASMMATRALTKYLEYNQACFLLSGALTNIEGIESAKIVDMMKELGKCIVKNNPDAVNYDKEQLAEYIRNSTGEVKDCYDNFMKINGHRGINESEMRVKCWGDDLVGFCEALKGSLISVDKEDVAKTKDWTEYVEEIMALVKPSKRKGIKSQIIKARQGAWTREHTKSCCIQVTNAFRKVYNIMAKKMVEEGIIPDTDLIFFFTKEELGKLIAGDKALVKKAEARRKLYPTQCALRFEEVTCGKPVPIDDNTTIDKSDFQGTPASPGLVTGKARVIRSVEDANKLQKGEIMVVSLTDVGWTPYYCLASGLITEIGSCLSHGVVVAREYGLPTIVSVKDIMRSIKDGDIITMDGTKGTVTLVSKEKE